MISINIGPEVYQKPSTRCDKSWCAQAPERQSLPHTHITEEVRRFRLVELPPQRTVFEFRFDDLKR
jgi:hypothetical protein